MNEIMALDIGTGTVIGYIAKKEDDSLNLIARSQLSYDKRAVEEGRVVDIDSAVKTVKEIVSRLCDAAKTRISVAHFAVPGRGLKVEEIEASYELDEKSRITPREIRKLYRRQRPIVNDCMVIDEEVVSRRLDGEEVIDFRGQYGKKMQIKWLVSTLSREEVKNKRKIIEEAGLIPGQLVLEPRAAVEAAFPRHEFRPRMGVIDFGAGTIDAALLEEGKIRDFHTLIGSGDRLTRRLEEILLVDFKQAEEIKKEISYKSEITFKNLAGKTQTATKSDIVGWLSPLLKEELDPLKLWFEDRSPRILFISGGGSQFPFLPRLLANILKIKQEAIIARPPDPMRGVKDDNGLLTSPADYTAYGLLLLAAAEKGRYDLNITVNGDIRNRLVRGPEYTVSDLLANMGYRSHQPHQQAVKMVCIDGHWETKKKEERLKPYVEVNGEVADRGQSLRSGDEVLIKAAEKPTPVTVKAQEFLPDSVLTVKYREKKILLPPRLEEVKGEYIYPEEELKDGSEYESRLSYSRDEIVEVLSDKGFAPGNDLLWLKDGSYSAAGYFSVGETVVIEQAVIPEDFGLGRLTHSPTPPDRALEQTLK